MRNIKMLDLSEQYESMKEEILEKIDNVISSSQFILGNNVKQLENDIAIFSNATYGIGVGNGSDAIHIALQAAGVGQGDEVITTPFTFFATAGSIARTGATPVFVDICSETFNIDPFKIEEAITSRTKAIIPVHLYGQMANMEKIMEIANRYNLTIIEDAAQALGAEYKNKKPGEYGNAAAYSFFPTKNLGAYGDGGMIVTSDEKIAENSRIIRVHGSKPKYHHHILGYNSRLDELQAAILNIKFKRINEFSEQRRSKANYYTEELNRLLSDIVKTPIEKDGNYHVFHQYTLRVENRDELKSYLKDNGIDSMIYYPVPLHLQPVFSELDYKRGDFPVTEAATNQALSLPMFPELKEEDQQYIIEKIYQFYRGR